MFRFGRTKQREAAKLQQEYITRTVQVFMEHQLENSKVYNCYPKTLEQQTVAELVMLGAIDYSTQVVKAPEEAQFMAAINNLLVPLFGYQSLESAERGVSLFHAVYGENADPAAYDLMLIGGDAMAKYITAAESGDEATVSGVGLLLTNLLREGHEIQI